MIWRNGLVSSKLCVEPSAVQDVLRNGLVVVCCSPCREVLLLNQAKTSSSCGVGGVSGAWKGSLIHFHRSR